MSCITHPLIREGSIESRQYQLSIAMRALDANTMVILPTGLGKTAIALIVAASRLYNKGGKVLMLAPTKPLVEQHLRFFERHLEVQDAPAEATGSQFVIFTGEAPPDIRTADWNRATACFATPQVIKNDLLGGRYTLKDVSLLVVDECHRAVGNYAYVFVAQRYLGTADNPLVLAMTASPGGAPEKVQEVCANLGIEHIETRTESDPDVRPYVHGREMEIITLELPNELEAAIGSLQQLIDERLALLSSLNFDVPKRENLSMKTLSLLNAQIQERIQNRDRTAYSAASIYAELMKLRHAITLGESQGSGVLKGYVSKLIAEGTSPGGSRASQRLARDPILRGLYDRCTAWTEELHPKPDTAVRLVKDQLAAHPESRIILFASYRDTVQLLVNHLTKAGIACERFVGQATKDTEKGLSQKKQVAALDRFRNGVFRVLIATSVGEEGLDVPSTDLVIFYEAVPSEIRSIQRKGRTGRCASGRVVVLVTRGTADEVYRYVSQAKEKTMHKNVRRMGSGSQPMPAMSPLPEPEQARIDSFAPQGPRILVDDRETSSKVAEALSSMGAAITLRRLPEGDYAIGDRILVERKTARDFVDTLINRDLLGQLKALSDAAPRPIVIVEGGDLERQRDIHPNAIKGVLAAITVDLGITLLFTKDEQDTAQMLVVLARREEGGRGERKLHPHKSHRSQREEQEFLVTALPEIGVRHARLLLAHFKTVLAIANADVPQLLEVHGIGEKTARRIYDLFRRIYL